MRGGLAADLERRRNALQESETQYQHAEAQQQQRAVALEAARRARDVARQRREEAHAALAPAPLHSQYLTLHPTD